jgi:dsRNA-specific ribonuclease
MDHGAALDPDDPEMAEALVRENHVGRLWEMCARLHVRRPVANERKDAGDWVLALRVTLGERTYDSGPCRARSRSLAKHLAAKMLLDAIDAEQVPTPQAPSSKPSARDTAPDLDSDAPTPSTRDPRMILNEIQHAEWITAFGYEHVGAHGPPHARVFLVRAWAVLDGGERVETKPVHARSKRDAEALAAAHLLALVRHAREKEAARILAQARDVAASARTQRSPRKPQDS